eukprot:SAG31_NODE_4566_length_3132_cov_1.770524_3_plen_127_part_00
MYMYLQVQPFTTTARKFSSGATGTKGGTCLIGTCTHIKIYLVRPYRCLLPAVIGVGPAGTAGAGNDAVRVLKYLGPGWSLSQMSARQSALGDRRPGGGGAPTRKGPPMETSVNCGFGQLIWIPCLP